MDNAKLALCRTLTDQDLGPILTRGLLPAMVPDPDSAQVLTFVLAHFSQFRQVPSPQLVQQQFPGFVFSYAPDTAEYYVDQVFEQYAYNTVAATLLTEARNATTDNPWTLAQRLRTTLNSLLAQGAKHRQKNLYDDVQERWDAYNVRKNCVGLIGIPTPYDSLDAMTLGWQPEMYAGVVARPGVGKTWEMVEYGYAAWQAGYDVLFCNKEVTDETMARRWDAKHFQLDYERLRSGMLTTAEEQRYAQGLANLTVQRPAEWTWLHGANTVSEIAAKVEQLKPKLLIVDGAYLLKDEEGGRAPWERYTNISRGVKRLLQDFKMPGIISIQLGRSGDTKKSKTQITLSDVMGADAFAQDVDILVALDQTAEQKANGEMMHLPLKLRDGKETPFMTRRDWSTMQVKDMGVTMTIAGIPDADADVVDFV